MSIHDKYKIIIVLQCFQFSIYSLVCHPTPPFHTLCYTFNDLILCFHIAKFSHISSEDDDRFSFTSQPLSGLWFGHYCHTTVGLY